MPWPREYSSTLQTEAYQQWIDKSIDNEWAPVIYIESKNVCSL